MNFQDNPNPTRQESGKRGVRKPEYIVGIGASAGGLEALGRFFSQMPSRTGLAYVVVQHLAPDFKSVMDEVLARRTVMPVRMVTGRTEIEADCVYLIPPNKEMFLVDRCLLLKDKDSTRSSSLPIDLLFTSMASDLGDRAIAIVLSGTGSDGTAGISCIHEAGGMVIAQSEESAKFDGMPQSAIATGLVDCVTSPQRMPQVLLRRIGSPLAEEIDAGKDPADSAVREDQRQALFERLRSAFKTDFSHYKLGTVNRRIERRMASHRVETMEQYLRILDNDPEEVRLLYKDLLIGVTTFFRDAEAFALLEQEIIPALLASRDPGEQIRVWVPACASGEEAYSIAILFHEAMQRSGALHDITIFATDLHAESVKHAADGLYEREGLKTISPERLARYFTPHGDRFQVDSELRRLMVFTEQNLLKDAPFTNMDLVSCRNLLIYLTPAAQKKTLSMLHVSLNAGGTLFLGPSEALGELDGAFECLSRTWNLYRKRPENDGSSYLPGSERSSAQYSNDGDETSSELDAFSAFREPRLEAELIQVYDALLSECMPPSLLIGPENELVQVFGDAQRYIRLSRGQASRNILDLLEGSLRLAVGEALKRLGERNAPVTLRDIPVDEQAEETELLTLTAKSLADQPYTVIQFARKQSFEQGTRSDASKSDDFGASGYSERRILALENELKRTKEGLQTTIAELESTGEELQAANEELLASNEELQTTNEELHSVNEELFAVNAEFEKKNLELELLNADVDNLLKSTDIGTVFIDDRFCIRKFTPAIAAVFNLLPVDIGRSFDHITVNLVGGEEMRDLVKEVVSTKRTVVRETRDRAGAWYLTRIGPYMTDKDRSAGVVLTLVDITGIKKTERELRSHAKALENAKQDLEQFAYSVSHDLQTPLRAVSGYLDLLRKRSGAADAELGEYIDCAFDGALRLKNMINGLLTYTRIETRASDFEKFTLDSALEESIEAKQEEIEKADCEITREFTNLVVYGERRFIVYAFTELLENALRYRGSARLRIHIRAEVRDGRTLVSFRDNGLGIEPVNHASVFNIFYQEDPAANSDGIGVGLAICKRIVLKHGGSIELDSAKGMGTTIRFTLPNKEAEIA
ncbi:chemotaxis protein CheB [Pelagicoccus sp. SDUM812003]|uniref:chemotaxis protein CheB n=1 Tax=Pelagicoccus sp. SDUM812003 TaxID=3041267 RepID=UPI00280E2098|nr:chemotaxis protein CheB [Pelagicoccus sp. SDUM812003]MDQ8204175.1 chemotaxis protein CheB [Pelagicoccus sp. SDUM812003]